MDYNDERFEKITEAEVLKAIRTVEKDKQNGLIVEIPVKEEIKKKVRKW